tara:strand:- start:417 stop:605 length:189 start_codon:yes stop_codon:yes gene_type:complete
LYRKQEKKMKVGDLVKHKTTGELGVIIQLMDQRGMILAQVRKMNGSEFPHPPKVLEVLSENR